MIEMPRRSVTRFFIPLIDVLTLLFCIFLLMPVVRPGDDEGGGEGTPATEAERQQREKARLTREIDELRANKLAALQQRLAVSVLEIDEKTGKLYYYDRQRRGDRRVEVTSRNVDGIIEREKEAAGGRDVYFLLLRPRPTTGSVVFPQERQREEYDRWFEGIAHGYDLLPGVK
jgi:hypothetical protein